jgi:chaperonin GroES
MALDYSNLDSLLQQINLADGMKDEDLAKIGSEVVKDFEQDLASRKKWEEQHDQWMKLAIQVIENKSWPWLHASNVKYPLLATSAMQFQARSYPTLVTAPNVVKSRVIGEDPTGEKAKRAERISKHMSYQVLEEMENWDEDMDKACFILPIVGCVFKKIYYHADKGYNCSDLVLPKDLVVNYWAKDLTSATTKTHILYLTKNTIKEKQLNKEYLEYEVDQSFSKELDFERQAREKEGLDRPSDISDAPLIFLEQHCWKDLDEDGYKEPYIITVDYSQQKVTRITPRWEKDGVKVKDGKIIKIVPEEYFLKFSFIPNPDGGFYDLGFGALLGPLNETVNTLINQLIDAGTINNLQGGFIAKGIRLKAGDTSFTPGEWKFVQTSGDDIRKGIFPLPTKEPSSTLFQLLGTIVESGQKLASVAEIFVGKMPGQNTPATTTMATIEQGMKVFTAIYKRIYRSLTKEFKRLYRLNKIYLDPMTEFNVVDSQDLMRIGQSDYTQDDTDVRPAADPTSVSEMLRLTKAQAILELVPLGTINVQEATKRILEAQDQPEIEKLLNTGPPPPDPKMLEVQAKMEAEKAKTEMKIAEAQMKMMIEQQMGKFDMQIKQMELQMKAIEAQIHLKTQQQQMVIDTAKAQQTMDLQDKQHKQKIEQSDVQHKQKLQQTKEKSK